MNLKNTLKGLLSFSKKERIGFVILLAAIFIVAVVPFISSRSSPGEPQQADSGWVAAAAQLPAAPVEKNLPDKDVSASNYQTDRTENNYQRPAAILFSFDPNTLDAAGFKKLGLRGKTINTILNYRNKGGQFRKPDDLKKIYGLRTDEFERLKPYIRIAQRNYFSASAVPKPEATPSYPRERPQYKPRIIDINAADIAAFESLYGIGNKLASRIVNFRTKLGGFHSIAQVGETYGVPDSTFQRIKNQLKVNDGSVKKINLNTANYDELNAHPYINRKTAYLILKQRKEKGNFTSIEEVRDICSQTTDVFEKMAPYLSAE
ncbi:ComEA family DNA-binding protein [Niabella insulamsoli]|uniref:ComEA family DNA-binding protein n=1 Tax=Niabella insulamsoli TaxID=3144874 RepID=UPI0031FD45FB